VKAIILGAGQVGSSVAHTLAFEDNDVTVVDRNPQLLLALQERNEIRTITGHASHPDVLLQAGIADADMILAVTNSDEINMVACQIAYTLYHTPLRVARVRSRDYLTQQKLFATEAVPISFVISPEELVTTFIRNLIESPGVQEILDFADGKVQLVAVQALHNGPIVGQALRNLSELLPSVETRVVAIFRHDQAIIPLENTVIEPGDEIFCLTARRHIQSVVAVFRRHDKPNRRIMIAGGGKIGKRLAETTEPNYHVKLIELDSGRCRALAGDLHRTIVLNGDAAGQDLLKQEGIESTDMFCTVTNDDAVNILSAMLAKQLGARKVLSIINRTSYIDLVKGSAVDIALSPAHATIGALRPHILRGGVVTSHSLQRGAAEAIEIIVHGDTRTSQVVGRHIDEIALPADTVIGAIVRGDRLLFPDRETVIESQDHVIVFLADRMKITEVEGLFQVSITFI